MMYGGLNGSPLMRNVMQDIDADRVRRSFQLLQRLNPRLMEYQDINIENVQMRNALRKLQELGQVPVQERMWEHNYIVPLSDVDPREGEVEMHTLVLGIDTAEDREIRYQDNSSILTLVFPYLYTKGRGYFSLCSWNRDNVGKDINGMADENAYLTVAAYVKRLIHMADRRFGRCVEFLFFMLDFIKKKNIHSSSRLVLPIDANVNYTCGVMSI